MKQILSRRFTSNSPAREKPTIAASPSSFVVIAIIAILI